MKRILICFFILSPYFTHGASTPSPKDLRSAIEQGQRRTELNRKISGGLSVLAGFTLAAATVAVWTGNEPHRKRQTTALGVAAGSFGLGGILRLILRSPQEREAPSLLTATPEEQRKALEKYAIRSKRLRLVMGSLFATAGAATLTRFLVQAPKSVESPWLWQTSLFAGMGLLLFLKKSDEEKDWDAFSSTPTVSWTPNDKLHLGWSVSWAF